jgi:hypothetical protein
VALEQRLRGLLGSEWDRIAAIEEAMELARIDAAKQAETERKLAQVRIESIRLANELEEAERRAEEAERRAIEAEQQIARDRAPEPRPALGNPVEAVGRGRRFRPAGQRQIPS